MVAAEARCCIVVYLLINSLIITLASGTDVKLLIIDNEVLFCQCSECARLHVICLFYWHVVHGDHSHLYGKPGNVSDFDRYQ